MAYDKEIATRIRALVDAEPAVSEQRMFGGLAFLVHGNMAVAASGQGGILVRVDPADSEALVRDTAAYPMEMRGRSMGGWLRVEAHDVAGDRCGSGWIAASGMPARSRRRTGADAASLTASRGVAQPG